MRHVSFWKKKHTFFQVSMRVEPGVERNYAFKQSRFDSFRFRKYKLFCRILIQETVAKIET